MRAVRAVIVGEQALRFEAFELPDAPTGTQVLVQTERTVVSAGTELANYTGLEPDTRVPGQWCAYPWTPGYGGAGRVLAIGPDVEKINPKIGPGKRVYGIFKHATHALVDLGWELCVPVPDGLDSTEAVLGRMCGVAITAYQRARVSLGETVVIFGLGLVGNLAGQFFTRSGADVVGLDLSAQRRVLASETGFAWTVDPAGLSEEELTERLLAHTGGARPGVVVDAVGDFAPHRAGRAHRRRQRADHPARHAPRTLPDRQHDALETGPLPRRFNHRGAGMDDPSAEAREPGRLDRSEHRADLPPDFGRRPASDAALLPHSAPRCTGRRLPRAAAPQR